MIWSFLEGGLAYGLVLFVLLTPQTREIPLQVKFLNLEKEDIYLCWMSAYARENEILFGSHQKCFKIMTNDDLIMNTYVGHRFLALPVRRTSEITKQFFAMDSASLQYNISFSHRSDTKVDYTQLSLSYLWNNLLLRYRHEVVVCISVLLITLDLFGKRHNPSRAAAHLNLNQLAIPRRFLKAFATLMMLINHASYIFLADHPSWMRLGALPADLGGSMHLYCWLTGYNYSSKSKNHVWCILVAFLILEQFCRLPAPFAYESLVTIVVARVILSFSIFEDFLLNYSILSHAVLIALLLLSGPFLNADGLRILQISGFLYAIAGRLFVLPVNYSKQLIWLFAGGLQILIIVWKATLSEVDTSSRLEVIIAALCLSWYCFHLLLLGLPLKKPIWNPKSTTVMNIISRYSLEIYVIHLFLAYFYHLSENIAS